MYLLDTNIVSYWMRGDPVVVDRLKAHSPSELALSSITLAEIWYGIEKSAVKKAERRSKIERITAVLDVFQFDESAARSYAIIRARLEKGGIPISERDTQIAAVAMANRLTLITHNIREFVRVEGLIVEDWSVT